MKCLIAILRITRSDRLRNIMILKKLNISETIEDIDIKRRLRWFGHVVSNTSILNSSYKLDFNKKRPRGRPPKRWSDGIREQCGEPLLYIDRRTNDEMPSETRYSCGKQRDANPTHLSQVSHIYIFINIYIWIYSCGML